MINGTNLKTAIISGANNVLKYKASVDELNIFPVPDGDTGTNMSMTIGSAVRELEKSDSTSAAETAHITASAMLRGARGNSGVILSNRCILLNHNAVAENAQHSFKNQAKPFAACVYNACAL